MASKNTNALAIDRLLSEQADAIADLPPAKSAALAAYRERYAARPPAPKPTITKTDADQIAIEIQGDTPRLDWLILANALGASRTGFLFELVDQIAQATTQNRTPDQQAFDFMIAAIAGLKPRDEVEAMLGAQMVATHWAVMRHLQMLNHCETVPQLEAVASRSRRRRPLRSSPNRATRHCRLPRRPRRGRDASQWPTGRRA